MLRLESALFLHVLVIGRTLYDSDFLDTLEAGKLTNCSMLRKDRAPSLESSLRFSPCISGGRLCGVFSRVFFEVYLLGCRPLKMIECGSQSI